ncbi:MAG TPA: hypothetical protein VI306_07705 [Pyrinomonadaceae bacterium]
MSAQPEQWRVSTYEGTFETDLETLKQWILEGAVAPTDKVSKGNLSWIEAGRVPRLKDAFSGEVTPIVEEPPTVWQTPQTVGFTDTRTNARTKSSQKLSRVCHNHADIAPAYICRVCEATFCSECPKFSGGGSRVAICPLCGDMCRSYQEVTKKNASAAFQASGFGLRDFFRALLYPFRHADALISGAALYGLLLLCGLYGTVLAWMLLFGCISHVINHVSVGRLKRSYLPDFSEFSILEDVVEPAFLSLGITIVSWGPAIVLVCALIFGVINSTTFQAGLAQATIGPSQSETLTPEDLSVLSNPNADPKRVAVAEQKLSQSTEAARATAKRSQQEEVDPLAIVHRLLPYFGASSFLFAVLAVFCLWGIFYCPMALTVAGYTQSFTAVLNPLVGLDTIRRMRSTYLKAFVMVLLLEVACLTIEGIISYVTSPLALPFEGNLVANFASGCVAFYFNLVVACVLGLSLYKCADRLGIYAD